MYVLSSCVSCSCDSSCVWPTWPHAWEAIKPSTAARRTMRDKLEYFFKTKNKQRTMDAFDPLNTSSTMSLPKKSFLTSVHKLFLCNYVELESMMICIPQGAQKAYNICYIHPSVLSDVSWVGFLLRPMALLWSAALMCAPLTLDGTGATNLHQESHKRQDELKQERNLEVGGKSIGKCCFQHSSRFRCQPLSTHVASQFCNIWIL